MEKLEKKKPINGLFLFFSSAILLILTLQLVDFFINPEDLITEEIKSLLHHPGALEILDFAEGKIKLVSVYAKSSGVPNLEGGAK